MRNVLIVFALLPHTGVFAQEHAGTASLTHPILSGIVQEEQAAEYLTATNTIERGATVRYTAGQSISLLPGFVAQAGSVFRASIGRVNSRRAVEPGTAMSVRAFPNPFETATTVEYSLPVGHRVTFTLSDATGRLIHQSDPRRVESAGSHRRSLDLGDLPAGVYLYQVETESGRKMIRLIKK